MDEKSAKAIAAQLRQPSADDGIRTGKMMNEGNAGMNRASINILNPSKNDIILEIGMGNGFFIQEIVSRHPSIQYTGVDFSETMIAEATRLNKSWMDSGQVHLIHTSVNSLPFSDNTFTKIFTVNTLYFWDDEKKVLEELKRVLKPGGKLIITIRPGDQMRNYPFTQYGFKLFSRDQLITLLADNGFQNVMATENQEPDFELNGQKLKMSNIIGHGIKQ
jgi:ubiquinone/menaquinone biosynthesis C-methylase UbiE